MDNDKDPLDVAAEEAFGQPLAAIALATIDIAKSLRALSFCTYGGAVITQNRGN